jgi:HIRAN domain
MSLFNRRSGRTRLQEPSATRGGHAATDELVWLPGPIEVQVAGESFHEDAIMGAWDSVVKDGEQVAVLRAVLVPDPGNRHDPYAVAVYTADKHVGYLPRAVACQVQPALLAFARGASARRLVSCPADIRWPRGEPQVVLLLDPGPLGLPPRAFEIIPEMAATLIRLLTSLDEPVPRLTGRDQRARSALAVAEERRTEVEASPGREPGEWPEVERTLRPIASQLTQACDPMASQAWLATARATRYQKSRRDDTLAAITQALYLRRDNADAWSELFDLASAAPHVPTLLALFARVPVEVRGGVLAQLLSISHGRDRMSNLNGAGGERLREGLLELAESQGDTHTLAALTGVAGLAAEKDGDISTAVELWRRAVAAGSTDGKVADRFSIWLVKEHEYTEAAQVLHQALTVAQNSAELAERMRRRLARCQRNVPTQTTTMRAATPI